MKLRAAGFCLALLWGCALAAAAAQGKEGECLRWPQLTGTPGHGTPGRQPPLWGSLLETDLGLLGLSAQS